MNGSEDGEVVPAAVLSGAPIELQARTVRYERSGILKSSLANLRIVSTSQRRLPLNPETGTATTGEWIGISFLRVTGGRTH